ncbi:MAG: nicotinate-nucleotide adenylyltransferase [Aeoliella sp.]
MRLGLFGGSFDPVHLGHLELARQCQQQAHLDKVWFLPAANQPLKESGPVASDDDRCAMLELALTSDLSWIVDRTEIDRGGVSYTVDTLREIRGRQPGEDLFFLMGADSLHDLPEWREPEAILELATPLVVARAGEPSLNFELLADLCLPERIEEISLAMVEMPGMAISSTEIRARAGRGESLEGFVTAPVAEYILRHEIYQ